MDWEEYQKQYFNFLEAINRSTVISLVGSAILEDFPQNLPPSFADIISHDMEIIKEQFEKVSSQAPAMPPSEQPQPVFTLSYDPTRFKSELSFTLIDFLFTQGMIGRELKDVRLVLKELGLVCKNVLPQQDIVMTIAHMESFLNDSLVAICRKVPAIIENSQKQVTWEKALSHMTRGSLFEDLMAEYIDSQFRGKTIADRAVYFIKNHGLNLKLQGHILADLELAEQVRHLIIHNGGRIDERFKRRTGVTNLEVGSIYPLDDIFVRNVALSAAELGGQVFIAIAEKFFDEMPPILVRVYMQNRQADYH